MSLERVRAAALAALVSLGLGLALAAAACGERTAPVAERSDAHARSELEVAGQRFPELVNVRPVRVGSRTYDFWVMLRAPYASPSRFAAGWRVLTPAGEVLATKQLNRPHLGHGLFWRRQTGVRVPRGVRALRFEARDSVNGFGGRRLTVELP